MAVITTEKAGSLSLSRGLARVTTPVTTSMAIVKSREGVVNDCSMHVKQ